MHEPTHLLGILLRRCQRLYLLLLAAQLGLQPLPVQLKLLWF